MNLRRSLVAASLLALGLAVGTNAWSQAMQMRISHAAAESDWLHKSMLMFKDNVEKALPGQVAVSVHGASSLFRQGTEVPALQRSARHAQTQTQLVDPAVRYTRLHRSQQDQDEPWIDPSPEKANRRGSRSPPAPFAAEALARRRTPLAAGTCIGPPRGLRG